MQDEKVQRVLSELRDAEQDARALLKQPTITELRKAELRGEVGGISYCRHKLAIAAGLLADPPA